ncbi:hypothetical protein [Paeniclostridium hominis]|uniref:hypothetical protein n=1 Tax=Paeniclostridium hominis TaxID=2764329 RepID=UPI0022E28916|nr:hypothetical protein [Paeniclostridium hominis]
MSKVFSLVDTDVVIVKSKNAITQEQIDKYEKELTEKLSKKVIILPCGLEICDYKESEKTTINYDEIKVNHSSKEKDITLKAKIDIDSEEATKKLEAMKLEVQGIKNLLDEECMQKLKDTADCIINMAKVIAKVTGDTLEGAIENTNCRALNIYSSNSKPKYKVLNKEQFLELKKEMSDRANEEQWNRLAKGNKYIVLTEDESMGIQLYSLDNFFDNNNLSFNISN